MAFDWSKYQELAEELRVREDDAARRSSISRLYYAIYWQARLYLEANGFTLSRHDGSHTQVWREFQKGGRTQRGIGISGDRLHKNRLQADYESEIKRLSDLVDDSFQNAIKVQTYLGAIK